MSSKPKERSVEAIDKSNKRKWKQLLLVFCSTLVLILLVPLLWGKIVALLLGLGVFGQLFFKLESFSHLSHQALFEELNLDRYLDFLDYRYRSSKGKKQVFALQSLTYARAVTQFYQGHFQDSLKTLDKVNLDLLPKKSRKELSEVTADLRLQNLLFLRDFEGFSNLFDEVISSFGKNENYHKQRLTAMNHLLSGQEDDFFERIWRGEKLYLVTLLYYRGLNALNKGEVKRARSLFMLIADQNPAFFYVREAKRYVEELA